MPQLAKQDLSLSEKINKLNIDPWQKMLLRCYPAMAAGYMPPGPVMSRFNCRICRDICRLTATLRDIEQQIRKGNPWWRRRLPSFLLLKSYAEIRQIQMVGQEIVQSKTLDPDHWGTLPAIETSEGFVSIFYRVK